MRELVVFGLKQARACVFAGAFFAVLFLSQRLAVPGLPRYDLILVAAIAIQAALVAARLETVDELKVIALFHAVGLALELFKTSPSIGSWSYPEAGYAKLGAVPLYSGFMYAAVGSYMCQAWRVLDLSLERYPSYRITVPLCVAIYANFFTHHFGPDLRWVLAALVVAVFARTRVRFTVTARRRAMPLWLSFVLIGFFVWVAENVSTYLGAWTYPNQARAWTWVSLGKISSWSLLVIISFIIVADLKHLKGRLSRAPHGAGMPARPPAAAGD
jgi:uncharacterized membrane protein YoaT (DUF817 family)